ncbi:sigma-G inhibitor, Gin [Gottschalkia acidurici 9a]|uniref:Sigma-G inhibitor, Gin n=1 Tax=Gottschalkia acidurici (strain ATCC 7906 / DSM 604 / BCRC 14475 / CIP 104303 / KCTC 5404 / NCIMB 10678 / 9a) TaxID=1128398 RepID=K0AV93_GOTA9|nr:sigma factor G inhibitor Gin [Gottschalkia acidurici]AFS77189.1 sigma-G inhibitor, Gin [Gottschalkia acidurici 9a]
MEASYCKTCKKDNDGGIDLLGVHICRECLDSITNLEVGDLAYEYYKSVIGKVWTDYYKMRLN